MIKIGICDDEEVGRIMVRDLLEEYAMENGIEYQKREYKSGKDFLERAEGIDILLLDIKMDGISGIQLKDMLQREGEDVKILFFTNYMEEMPEAFGKNVYGFLRKPIRKTRLRKYMDRMLEDLVESRSIVIRSLNQDIAIQVKDIYYFMSDKKYSRMVSTEGIRFCDMGLNQLEGMLKNKPFFRCHKSYLVNFANIHKIEDGIYMKNGERIPISRRKARELKDSYLAYIIRKAH